MVEVGKGLTNFPSALTAVAEMLKSSEVWLSVISRDFLKNCGTRCFAKIIGTYTRSAYGSPEYIGGIIDVERVIFLNNDN